MSPSRSVRITAPVKLTRSLRVVGVRPDGYHLLDAEMVGLAWGDELTITPGGDGLRVGGRFAAGVPTDDTNLVARALRLCRRRAAVEITKHVPHGAGLGGGSADAAAVLRWAGWTAPGEVAAAAALGADVPFCVHGGRARVTGIGELIEPLDHIDLAVVLVVPPLHVSTPAVYRCWDRLGGPHDPDGVNDLRPAAERVEPRLSVWRERIAEVAGTAPRLAGSGATWFVEHADAQVAAALTEAFPEALVVRTSTVAGAQPAQ